MSFFSPSSRAVQLEKNTDKVGKKAKPGDLIEIFRRPHSHWAVYIGNGNVVHFGAPSSSIGGVGGIVEKEKLQKVVKQDSWRVNNTLDEKYKPLPPNEIVKKACSLVGVPRTYHLTMNNCEHFATEMRYGTAESRQVQNVQNVIVGGGLMASVVAVAGVIITGVTSILRLLRAN